MSLIINPKKVPTKSDGKKGSGDKGAKSSEKSGAEKPRSEATSTADSPKREPVTASKADSSDKDSA